LLDSNVLISLSKALCLKNEASSRNTIQIPKRSNTTKYRFPKSFRKGYFSILRLNGFFMFLNRVIFHVSKIQRLIKNQDAAPEKAAVYKVFTATEWLFLVKKIIKSISREEYPISLSYHPTTFTILSITEVSSASNKQDNLFPKMSTDTIGSSV